MRRNRNNLLSLAEQSFKPLEKTIEGKLVGGFAEIVNNCDCVINNCNCDSNVSSTTTTTTTTTTILPSIGINLNC